MTSATQRWPDRASEAVSQPKTTMGWGFARNVAILGGGSALAQGLTVLLAPVFTRIYVPRSIGQYGLFASFLNVVLVVVSVKYELGIVIASTEQKAAQLAFASFLFSLPMSLLGAGLMYLLIHFRILGFGILPSYAAVLMAAVLIFGATYYVLRYWFVRREQFGHVSKATVAQSSGRSISQIVFGLFGAKVGGLLGGELVGRCAGMSRMFQQSWPEIRAHIFPIDGKAIREVLRENWRFPAYSFPSSLIDSLSANICIPLIVLYYGSDAGGYYSLVQRVLAIPLVLFSTSIADAFHGRLALYARETPEQVPRLFRRTTALLLCLGVVPAILLFYYAAPVFRVVFGSRWIIAGELAAVTAPLFLAEFVVSPLSRLVVVLDGQRFKLIYDGVALASMIAVFVFSARRHFSLSQAVAALSATGTLTFLVYYFVLLAIVARHRRDLALVGQQDLPA